jgi:4a-hydroxytetrahydrobiopterin dehydratase
MTGIRIVDDVAVVAEGLDHHPDVDIRWREVTFTLSTHSQGGVTERDVELARRIDAIAERHGAR